MLYGWLEVGASNVPVFISQSNQDIILRTTNSNNKMIFGNQMNTLHANSNVIAAMYIINNNVGINKVPSVDYQCDIHGRFRIDNNMTFTETMPSISNQPTVLVNSNNAFSISYNDIKRMYFTHSNGINVCDTLYSTSDIYAPAFHVTSDSNLKREIILSSSSNDLNIVNSINVYDYRFYNSIVPIKGFIAQQVEMQFPRCVTKTMGFIHSSIVSVFINREGVVKKSVLPFDIDIGERIVVKANAIQYEYSLYKIIDDDMYFAGDSKNLCSTVTLIGKYGILRTLDVNQLMALSFNSIKELTKRIEKLEGMVLKTSQDNIVIDTTISITPTTIEEPKVDIDIDIITNTPSENDG